ncbi:hypothetical protein E5676_scaffold244G00040 [Cucumis melo var. makuwa]|uniref:Uncharacterized protein n=1 Tax=Cucumis melo var. makuwa TaxID=1194695 RepID=A0A5D3DUB2_CUCMM|nr:hypothetical protein E5676_scaffold244G00040 [Cucumis melo var. makuwa]
MTAPSPPPIKTYKAAAQSQPNEPSKNEVIFQFTGYHYGGFIGSSNRTDRGLNLQAARLKVNTNNHGLIPTRLILPKELGGTEITVKIRGVPTTTNRLGMMAAKSNGAVKDSSELAAAHIKFNSAVTNLGHPTRQKKKSPTVSLLNQPVYSHSPDSQPFELSTDFPNLPSMAMVTFQNGFSDLQEGSRHMATPTNQPQTFSDMASILLQHGLCVMAIPSLPSPKAKKPCTGQQQTE